MSKTTIPPFRALERAIASSAGLAYTHNDAAAAALAGMAGDSVSDYLVVDSYEEVPSILSIHDSISRNSRREVTAEGGDHPAFAIRAYTADNHHDELDQGAAWLGQDDATNLENFDIPDDPALDQLYLDTSVADAESQQPDSSTSQYFKVNHRSRDFEYKGTKRKAILL